MFKIQNDKRTKKEILLDELERRYQETIDPKEVEEIIKTYKELVTNGKPWAKEWKTSWGNPFGSLQTTEGEVWMPLTDNFIKTPYLVSSNGKVFNLRKSQYLRPYTLNGDLTVALTSKAKQGNSPVTVKRLVADCFIPNPNNWSGVWFKDGDHTNVCVDNLERYETEYDKKYGGRR